MRILFIPLITLSIIILSGCEGGNTGLSQPASKMEISKSKEIGCPIAFSTTHAELNSAGGVDVAITWKNVSDKTLKYVYVEVGVKNNVGDIIKGSISRKTNAVLEYVGPHKPNKNHWGGLATHKAVLYNESAKQVFVKSVWVMYMDGSRSEKFDGTKLPSTTGPIKRENFL